MKFITLAIIMYFAYRLFLKPFLLIGSKEQPKKDKPVDDSEYIDYEEVD